VAALMPMLGLVILLGLLVAGLGITERWLSGGTARRPRPHSPSTGDTAPRRRPLQVVAADVRRLSRQLALVPAGAPLVRWKALWAAYDAVLVEAAEQLEVSHELATAPVGMLRDLERLRLLAALEGAGLTVRG
jgi:hypothetical protein